MRRPRAVEAAEEHPPFGHSGRPTRDDKLLVRGPRGERPDEAATLQVQTDEVIGQAHCVPASAITDDIRRNATDDLVLPTELPGGRLEGVDVSDRVRPGLVAAEDDQALRDERVTVKADAATVNRANVGTRVALADNALTTIAPPKPYAVDVASTRTDPGGTNRLP